MTIYRYKARNKAGKIQEGTLAGNSQGEVAAKLRQMQLLPIVLTAVKEEPVKQSLLDRLRGVKFVELNLFTRQLLTLQKAGIPLLKTLGTLEQQTSNATLKAVIKKISKDIEEGSDLSTALARHPRIFNALYVNMIKSGEVSGKLIEILERQAILGEHEERVRLQIKAAVRYPIIVLVTIVIGFVGLINFVVPRFSSIYGRFGTELPLPTQILIGLHHITSNYWWLMIIAAVLFIVAFRKFISLPGGRHAWDYFRLKIPIFGPLLLKMMMSRFCRVMATLLQSGVPLLKILELVSQSTGNVVISRIIDEVGVSVNSGKGITAPMETSKFFPPIVIQMMKMGEESGKLDELLLHVSDYYDSEIDYTIKNLVALIEPILIFVLGLTVLFMALGIFMPMWNIIHLFKQ